MFYPMISRFHSFLGRPFYVLLVFFWGHLRLHFYCINICFKSMELVTITNWCLSWAVSFFTGIEDWEGFRRPCEPCVRHSWPSSPAWLGLSCRCLTL